VVTSCPSKASTSTACHRQRGSRAAARAEQGGARVSMRFGYGDGATNRATVARYRSCCLADFSAAPLVGRSEEGTTVRHRGLTRGTLHTTRATSEAARFGAGCFRAGALDCLLAGMVAYRSGLGVPRPAHPSRALLRTCAQLSGGRPLHSRRSNGGGTLLAAREAGIFFVHAAKVPPINKLPSPHDCIRHCARRHLRAEIE
jgi:hypothetical protein